MKKQNDIKREQEMHEKEQYERKIANLITEDFLERRKQRLFLERQWQLNINFLNGNQYYGIDRSGELCEIEKDFYWQRRQVFNHIAPIMETRKAKLNRVTPVVNVRAKSNDDKDKESAITAKQILLQAFKNNNITEVVKRATSWSENLGTSFYQIIWNNDAGNVVGKVKDKNVYEGEVEIKAISPFEIFPDNLNVENIENCNSIIHAKALTVEEIQEKYGVQVVGENIDIFSLQKCNGNLSKIDTPSVLNNSAIVIEKYCKPNAEFPNGRLITVCNNKILFDGELPYINGENGTRTFPFIKQESIKISGNFFGQSIIERLIPIQRAYNAVKNRKHEFLNRLSMGVMTVEDGSIDVDDLAGEGLSPGKIIVYRQGSKAPEIMDETELSPDFKDEEEKLLNEFVAVSGVSDVSSSSSETRFSSGSALQLLIEQDNERMTMVAENIRNCYIEFSKMILRLYAEFTVGVRTVKYLNEDGKISVSYFDKKVATNNDVYLESENELLYTPSQKTDMIMKIYESGLLTDEKGAIRNETKERILELLGYKDLSVEHGLSKLQESMAQKENLNMNNSQVEINITDDDNIHIETHTRFYLAEFDSLSEETKGRLLSHIEKHKERLNQSTKEIKK